MAIHCHNTPGLPDQTPVIDAPFDPEAMEEILRDRDQLDVIVSKAEGLVRALQIVLWDFANERLEREVSQKRSALIAVANALEAVFDRADGTA